jgi:hypothetical protein
MKLISMMAIGLVAPVAMGATYTGSLSSASGEIGGMSAWIDPGPTTMSWEITDMTTHYHYKYVLTVPESSTDISHLLIEVSSLFGEDDFWNETGPFLGTEISEFSQENGNPSIPEAIHGLKFDDMTGTTVAVEFDSLRVPIWGDFYAKGGGNPPNEAWNLGINFPDPLDPPSNGSINNHILVPDTNIPEPASLVLMALSGLLIAGHRRPRTCP